MERMYQTCFAVLYQTTMFRQIARIYGKVEDINGIKRSSRKAALNVTDYPFTVKVECRVPDGGGRALVDRGSRVRAWHFRIVGNLLPRQT